MTLITVVLSAYLALTGASPNVVIGGGPMSPAPNVVIGGGPM